MKLIKQTLISGAVILVTANIISRFLGFFRESLTASYFGTSDALDLFIIAFTVPELISNIMIATIPSALMPAINKKSNKKDFWSGFIFILVLGGILSIITCATSTWFFTSLTSSLDQRGIILGSRLMKILSSIIIIRGIDSYISNWLHKHKHFLWPAVSRLVLNIGMITVLILTVSKLDIYALAIAWVIGAIFTCVINIFAFGAIVSLPAAPKMTPGFLSRFRFAFISVALIELLSFMQPVIDRLLANSYLSTGQLAALRYGRVVTEIPIGLFVMTLGITVFPWLTDAIMNKNAAFTKKLYRTGIYCILCIVGSIGVFFILFSKPIISFIFMRGAFSIASLSLTLAPFKIYIFGSLFYSMYIFQMRFYFASRRLLRLGVILGGLLLSKAVLSYYFVHDYDHVGLAIATSITWLIGFLIMTFDLRKCLHGLQLQVNMKDVIKIFTALLLTTALWIPFMFWGKINLSTTSNAFIAMYLTALFVFGNLLLIFVLKFMDIHEINGLGNVLNAKLFKFKLFNK